jgi:uncharacterized membrane protein YgcG
MKLIGEQQIQHSQWCVWLQAISIWMNESRVVVFFSNILILCLSFATVIYAETKNKYAVLAIVLMNLPFAWGHALVAVMFVGKSLELYDNDFLVTYYGLLKLLTLGFYHVDVHALAEVAEQDREEALKEEIGPNESNNESEREAHHDHHVVNEAHQNADFNEDEEHDIAIQEWKLTFHQDTEYSDSLFSSSSASSSSGSSSSSSYSSSGSEESSDRVSTESAGDNHDTNKHDGEFLRPSQMLRNIHKGKVH